VSVSFKTLDLNLLKVFDAVMEERSVLRASQKVALSQSAVSHSLARLREMLEDDLFVRTATGMQPTGRALAMALPVRDALRSLEAAVELPKFNPANSTKQFTARTISPPWCWPRRYCRYSAGKHPLWTS
jgi:DNA-binding transcriptional LysR family regulator